MIAFNSSGELRLEDNCFINSPVSPSDASSVVTLFDKATVKSANNFLDVVQSDIQCPYMVDIDNDLTIQCRSGVVFNAITCASNSSYTMAPTPPPTDTSNPAITPTAAPTTMMSAAHAPHGSMPLFGMSAPSISLALTGVVTIFVCENIML
jgi:hypothetical protein